jgi:hypothetical protein
VNASTAWLVIEIWRTPYRAGMPSGLVDTEAKYEV